MANIMKVNSPAVVISMGLTKIYQTGIVALDDLTLTIEPGMSFGLMGEIRRCNTYKALRI